MQFIFLCALALHIWKPHFILEKSENSATTFQHLCKVTVENFDSTSSTRSAILCGTKITDFSLLNDLKESGLIHLFIVSGSHLQILIFLLQQIKVPTLLINAFVVVFTLMTGFQAPLVRVVVQFFLRQYFERHNVLLRTDLVVLCSALICLGLFPKWIGSYSFHLSWMAALALSIPIHKSRSLLAQALLRNFFICFGLSLYLFQFSAVSINSWLFNLLIGTLVGPLLIPLALTPLWTPFINAIQLLLSVVSPPNALINLPRYSVAPILFSGLWHFLVHIYRRQYWRRQC